MPLKRDWQSRIKAVEREYVAMHQAAVRFQHAALNDPGILEENLKNGEILAASRNLEATYIIRLFAEFESGARQYWSTVRPTNPPVADLIIGLAARRRIPETQQGTPTRYASIETGWYTNARKKRSRFRFLLPGAICVISSVSSQRCGERLSREARFNSKLWARWSSTRYRAGTDPIFSPQEWSC